MCSVYNLEVILNRLVICPNSVYMRVCFDSLCFASHRLAEDDAGHLEGAGEEGGAVVSEAVVFAMGSATDVQTILSMKDERIRELEAQISLQEKEIIELRSHLDKFQSVFPYYLASPGHLNSLNNNYQPRARKQRAQGISAEPQSLNTIQELSQQQFPTFPKNDR